jgi:hypothetical protein
LRNQVRSALLICAVVMLAGTLTLALASGAVAQPAPQTSPLVSTPVRSPVAPVAPAATPIAPPPAPPTLEAPTSVPLPVQIVATPTVAGFLPAPTIVNPDDIKELPLAQPNVSDGGSEPERAATPAPQEDRGLRAAVAFLNTLWYFCGAALLIGGAVAIFLLSRRNKGA